MFRISAEVEGVTRFVMARRFMGRDLYRSACYLAGDILIDSGAAFAGHRLAEALASLHLSAIAHTHGHEDHIGGNAALQRQRNIPAFAHELAIPALMAPGRTSLHPYQKFFFGRPAASESALPLKEALSAGRHTFRVIATPGHSDDHVAFFEPANGWLFSGDAFLGGKDRVFRRSYDIHAMIRTLRVLAGLSPEVMFTGAGPVLRSPRKQIEKKRAQLEDIVGSVRRLRSKGMSEKRIALELFPGDTVVRVVTSGDFSAENLVRAALAPDPGNGSCKEG